ncbi:AGE family epimerase/isomerase [Salmonirosea aquatica]|uniref:N-acylglucosamine 2-epimerase n=1 Tax=Salmonirosea aquatica TaxID=2654236 RepID=A0A7C9FS73_9BACT|nr:hypothetical protein [Cytophagaceae bacterium SJW1-29]
MDIQQLAQQYRDELMQNVLPFWQKHAFDPMYGGVFEAVDETGGIISTDKPVALQAQVAWAFAMAHNRFGPNKEWLGLAQQTVDFLLEKGRDAKGTWYGQLDRRGTPLVGAPNAFPDLYMALALGQIAQATEEISYAEIAQKTLVKLLKKRDSSIKKQKEIITGRGFKSLEEFALIGHALLQSETHADKKWYQKTLESYLEEFISDFYDKRTDIVLENVTPEGHFWDCPEGRMLVPGRVFEMAGFMMDIADRTRNRRLLNQMLDLTELTLQAAWDEAPAGDSSSGGFFYQMDIKSLHPLQPRWNHKLAWVHLEALQTLLKAHVLSANPIFLATFEKTHEYVWEKFPDKTHGGWFGELTREGVPFIRHKITPEKGFYAMVRNLANIADLLEIIAKSDASPKRSRKVV